jgi:DNA (cytosine-5)-methyltransferase 1
VTFGSLFAGIGGLDLGLERAGMKCCWQVENDGLAQKVLEAHWPRVRRHGDVRTFPPGDSGGWVWSPWVNYPVGWGVQLVCGGFPCHDISDAGRRAGIEGEQSGLWSEFARVIRVLRPRYVLVENVTGLLCRGMGTVLADLAASGYDAEWDCVPAAAVGAPHLRARTFLLAYSRRVGGQARHDMPVFAGRFSPELCGWWRAEPGVGRVVHGLPVPVDQLRCLGNAVVPQVAEWIGRRIMEAAHA